MNQNFNVSATLPHTTMDKNDFIVILRIVLDECNYFLYDGQF